MPPVSLPFFAGTWFPATFAALLWVVGPVSPNGLCAATLEAPLPEPGEVQRVTVREGDRRTTYIELVPSPALPSTRLAPPPVARPVPPTAAELAEEQRLTAKPFQNLTLRATVYTRDPLCTVLTWEGRSGRTHRAVSNVDFRLLTPLASFETEACVYSWLPFVDVGDPDDPARPRGVSFPSSPAQFVVDGAPAPEADLDALRYLHAYADAHRAELTDDLARREAEAVKTEREQRELREHPPKKPDAVFRFSISARPTPSVQP